MIKKTLRGISYAISILFIGAVLIVTHEPKPTKMEDNTTKKTYTSKNYKAPTVDEYQQTLRDAHNESGEDAVKYCKKLKGYTENGKGDFSTAAKKEHELFCKPKKREKTKQEILADKVTSAENNCATLIINHVKENALYEYDLNLDTVFYIEVKASIWNKPAKVKTVNGDSILTLHGDKIKLQNGFGAYGRTRYECSVNLNSGDIVSIDFKENR